MNTRWFEFDRDLEPIIIIDTKGCEEYWTEEEFKKKLGQKSISCIVAEEQDIVVGFLIYELFLHRLTILRIGVFPAYRHQGIGTTLLKELSEKLTSKRKLISAEVRETNIPVQLFLKSQKYKAVKVLRNYYPETNEDAFVFHYMAAD